MDIISTLTGMQTSYGSLIKDYQLLATALILPLIYFIPRIFTWLKSHCSNLLFIVLNIDEADNVSGDGFANFNAWLAKNRIEWLSRTFEVNRHQSFTGRRAVTYRLTPGTGLQAFKYQGAWFLLTMSRRESKSATNFLTGSFGIITCRWNRHLLEPLIEESFRDREGYVPYIVPVGASPSPIPEFYGRQLQLISAKSYKEMDEVFKRFARGDLPYSEAMEAFKESVLLYGPPGTGKTNLVRHFAVRYQMDVVTINPDTFMKDALRGGRTIALDNNGIIYLIEDIDSNPNFCNRGGKASDKVEIEGDFGEYVVVDRGERGSLSELLNGLDGIQSLSQALVIMTTNHPEKLHQQIYREGRVDHHIALEYLTTPDLIKHLKWTESDPRLTALLNGTDKRLPAKAISRLMKAETVEQVETIIANTAKVHSLKTYKEGQAA